MFVRSQGPLAGPYRVPASKPGTHRALVITGLADGATLIRFPLHSSETLEMMDACRSIGAQIVPGKGRSRWSAADWERKFSARRHHPPAMSGREARLSSGASGFGGLHRRLGAARHGWKSRWPALFLLQPPTHVTDGYRSVMRRALQLLRHERRRCHLPRLLRCTRSFQRRPYQRR